MKQSEVRDNLKRLYAERDGLYNDIGVVEEEIAQLEDLLEEDEDEDQ